MPEVKVGAMLIEDELIEESGGLRGGTRGIVAVGGGPILESDDLDGVEHEMV